jgi:hypothetical protein
MLINPKVICPCITKHMFLKALSHNNPSTLFEVINYFSMIDGHVHHIMKVLEDSTRTSTSLIFSVARKRHALKHANKKGR